MKRHILSKHTAYDDLPYVCTTCPPENPKRYGSKDRLKEHISLVHLGQRNYHCPNCRNAYNRPSILRRHLSKCLPNEEKKEKVKLVAKDDILQCPSMTCC